LRTGESSNKPTTFETGINRVGIDPKYALRNRVSDCCGQPLVAKIVSKQFFGSFCNFSELQRVSRVRQKPDIVGLVQSLNGQLWIQYTYQKPKIHDFES